MRLPGYKLVLSALTILELYAPSDAPLRLYAIFSSRPSRAYTPPPDAPSRPQTVPPPLRPPSYTYSPRQELLRFPLVAICCYPYAPAIGYAVARAFEAESIEKREDIVRCRPNIWWCISLQLRAVALRSPIALAKRRPCTYYGCRGNDC